ncbi:MAG: hypothetical protein NT023_16580 [Armatimonadetes bacterium]|nr:hypothetical protein [Armatimonadota bacterium]
MSHPPEAFIEPRFPDTPFVVVNERKHLATGNSTFHPDAHLVITPTLRTSGLLSSLPSEDLKNLLYILTFVTANGNCSPTISELAQAMGVSAMKVRLRLNRLIAFQWRNEPLVYFLERESGMNGFTPSHSLVGIVSEVPKPPEEPPPIQSHRDEIIALSREKYARPREEVEREIASLNGSEIPEQFATEEEKERNELLRRLCAVGLERGQANEMLSQYPTERIRRQLDWLPSRGARLPVRYLVAAIEGDYDAPPRQRGVFQESILHGERLAVEPDITTEA